MKRTQLRRKTQLRGSSSLTRSTPLTARSGLRARSPKRAVQMSEYRPQRDAFLAEHRHCEFPLGCGQPSTQVHHRRGRRGARLLDRSWWAASCDFHNDYAETNTGHSLTIGWLVRIEGAPR